MNYRRDFLKQSSLIALAPTVPGFLSGVATRSQPKKDDRVLVVIQLDGGNDGVNTLVPFKDEGYRKHRNRLVIPTNQLLKINDSMGLHPQMQMMSQLWQDDQLALMPGVGYPNPNRSHSASMAIWQTCRFAAKEQNSQGWIGTGLDQNKQMEQTDETPDSLIVGADQPEIALQGRQSVAGSINYLKDFILPGQVQKPRPADSQQSLRDFVQRTRVSAFRLAEQTEALVGKIKDSASYPKTRLGNNLQTIAHLIKGGFGTRVYYAVQSGYDMHANQMASHASLLSELSNAVGYFIRDLQAAKLDERVVVMGFSEFGRRVDENGSYGTDHGTSGLSFLAGTRVRAGVYGEYPKLTELDDGGMTVSTDFRNIYAAVLENWLGLDSVLALGGKFTPMDLFDSP